MRHPAADALMSEENAATYQHDYSLSVQQEIILSSFHRWSDTNILLTTDFFI
jgi:hypothetical protein